MTSETKLEQKDSGIHRRASPWFKIYECVADVLIRPVDPC